MILSSSVSDSLGFVDSAIVALLGYAVVFFGLILLMIVIVALGKIFVARANKPVVKLERDTPAVPAAPAAAPVPVAAPAPVPTADAAAPGTAGQLKLYDTPPKTAAIIMAIVANKMNKPLNELRFISIKEVK